MGVPIGVLAKEFAANFLNGAVELDHRSSGGHLNFPFRDRDSVAVNGSRESRGPKLRDVSVYVLLGRERISAMTRTLAAPMLESRIAGAMSFIFEMIDLSKIEIFLLDAWLMKRTVQNQWR